MRRASLWQRHQKHICDVKNAYRLFFAFLHAVWAQRQRQQLSCCCFVALFRYYFFYELKLFQRCTVATSIEPCRCIYPLFCHFVPPLRLPSENATDMFLLFVTLCSTFALFGMTLRNKITSISYRQARCNAYNCTLCIETMWRLARLCSCACCRFSVLSFSSVFAQRWAELDFCYWHWFCISLDCIIMFFCWFHFAQCLVLVGIAFATWRTPYPAATLRRLILLLFVFRGTWSVFPMHLPVAVVVALRPKIASPIEQKRAELAALGNNLWKVFNLQNIQKNIGDNLVN